MAGAAGSTEQGVRNCFSPCSELPADFGASHPGRSCGPISTTIFGHHDGTRKSFKFDPAQLRIIDTLIKLRGDGDERTGAAGSRTTGAGILDAIPMHSTGG